MKLGIMQPYLFPYIGYWQLINYCDHFVVFDVVQYNKRSWMNRNRILHPNREADFQYITVPISKHPMGTLVSEVCINNNGDWRKKILGQLTVYKNMKAKNYNEVYELVQCVVMKSHKNLIALVFESILAICNYLNIDATFHHASNINFDCSEVDGPGDWSLVISSKFHASSYINPVGGYAIFDEGEFRKRGIDLMFLKSNLTRYKQAWRKSFFAGLSIIDAMMFLNKDELLKLINCDFRLYSKDDLLD